MRSDVDPVQTSKEIQFEKMLKLILFQAYSLGLVSKTFEKRFERCVHYHFARWSDVYIHLASVVSGMLGNHNLHRIR